MIPMHKLFEQDEEVVVEGVVADALGRAMMSEDKKIAMLLKKPHVKEFVNISRALVKAGKPLSDDKMNDFEKLLKHKDVKAYLSMINQTAREKGFLKGATSGTILGGLAGLIAAGSIPVSVPAAIAAFALFGAGLGGMSLGGMSRSIAGYLARKEDIEQLRKRAVGVIGTAK